MSTLKAVRYAFLRFVLRRPYLTARGPERRFRVMTNDVVGRHIYKYGQHDPAMSRYLRRHVNPVDGDLLIDIGANIGWYSVLFAEACRDVDAKVLSFEPDPLNFALLTENVDSNGLSDVVMRKPVALSDNPDGATLHLFPGGNRGRHSLLPIHGGERVDIETVCLDDVMLAEPACQDRRPRLIKIDIEGFELIALRGATQTLARCPMVILEYSPQFMRDGDLEPSQLLDLMFDLGFTPHELREDQLVATTRELLLGNDMQTDLIWQRTTD